MRAPKLELFLTLLTYQHISFAKANRNVIAEQRIVEGFLKDTQYNSLHRPTSDGGDKFSEDGATQVECSLFVRSFGALDMINMDYSVDITLRQRWRDPRLMFKGQGVTYVTVPETRVWKPDTFLRNEKSAEFGLVPSKAVYVRVFEDGTVLYSTRIKAKLQCPMNLRLFPFDSQTCKIMLASYSLKKTEIEYLWKKDDGIQFTRALSLPGFRLRDWKARDASVLTSTGAYSAIEISFLMARETSYHVTSDLVPLAMLVIMSILSFWPTNLSSTARVCINLGLVVFASFLADKINDNFPVVGYTKAIDIWTGTTIMFLFLGFVASIFGFTSDLEDINVRSFRKVQCSGKVLILARAIYPALYLVFTILYFGYFLNVEQDCLNENCLL